MVSDLTGSDSLTKAAGAGFRALTFVRGNRVLQRIAQTAKGQRNGQFQIKPVGDDRAGILLPVMQIAAAGQPIVQFGDLIGGQHRGKVLDQASSRDHRGIGCAALCHGGFPWAWSMRINPARRALVPRINRQEEGMLDWIGQHSSVVQAGVGVITALVWLVYLHIMVSGFRRQRRSEILITLGGPRRVSGHLFVSNLGFEPIYVLDILLTCCRDQEEVTVSIVDRFDEGDTGDGRVTLQMPLNSGDHVDAGRISDLLERAQARSDRISDVGDFASLRITVAALTAANAGIVAAERSFRVLQDDDEPVLQAEQLYARQIRGRHARKSIEAQLKDDFRRRRVC